MEILFTCCFALVDVDGAVVVVGFAESVAVCVGFLEDVVVVVEDGRLMAVVECGFGARTVDVVVVVVAVLASVLLV